MIKSSVIKYLLPAGLMLQSFNMILMHYKVLPDFAGGLLSGVALGLIVLALVKSKKLNKA